MRLTTPRIPPLPESEWSGDTRKHLEAFVSGKRSINVMATLAQHWDAAQHVWGDHVMGPTLTLKPRARELLILRTGWLCKSNYEWGRHVLFARQAGLSDEDIRRVKSGPDDQGWSASDAALLRAADELHAGHMVSDATWAALARHYEKKQLMDVVFTVGQYTAVCMALNSFGVQLEPGVTGLDGP